MQNKIVMTACLRQYKKFLSKRFFAYSLLAYLFIGAFVASILLTQSALAQIPQSKNEIQASFAPVVAKVAPAVVNVYAKRLVKTRRSPLFDDPFFGEFFGRNFDGRERVQNSLGSGVIISPDGIVVTNNHLIRGSAELTVVLADRREFKADILLADERTDLAVLQIKADDDMRFAALEYHNSDAVAVGDLVLAIGNPFGIGQTVTSGIVSALARTQVGVSDFQSFIQTDAAINPGNSGGALVTMDGRLLGINTVIYTRSGGSLGIGFAIPSNMVQQVVRATLSDGKIIRPWLGAQLQNVSQSLADTVGLPRPIGALILAMHPQSPLQAAGLMAGDVIIAIAGRDINTPEELRYRLAVQEIGGRVGLVYLRDGTRYESDIALIVAPETPPRNQTWLSGNHPLNGLEIANINPAVEEELGAHDLKTGVIVVGIKPSQTANRARLRVGDIVQTINGKTVKKVADVQQALTESPARWQIEYRRGKRLIRSTIR
ncbi:MAG: Do family serine endopeptidase [Alphaproteobacteria bacterium]|nr:Do family serine endopeptidase [Alphaproteobacteria bacterium]